MKWIKIIILVSLCLFLSFSLFYLQKGIDQFSILTFEARNPVFLPNGNVLKWMSMGYRGALGDWLWIRSVLYYGRRVKDADNPYYVLELRKEYGDAVN